MSLHITPALDAQLVELMERYRAKYRANPDQRIELGAQLRAEFCALTPPIISKGDIGEWVFEVEAKLFRLVFRPIYKSKKRA
jgi:hypothetical protein